MLALPPTTAESPLFATNIPISLPQQSASYQSYTKLRTDKEKVCPQFGQVATLIYKDFPAARISVIEFSQRGIFISALASTRQENRL